MSTRACVQKGNTTSNVLACKDSHLMTDRVEGEHRLKIMSLFVCSGRMPYLDFAGILVLIANRIDHINTPTWEQEYGVVFPGEQRFDFQARLRTIWEYVLLLIKYGRSV